MLSKELKAFADAFCDAIIAAEERDRKRYEAQKNRACEHPETKKFGNADGSVRTVCMVCLRRVS